jgi:hypothetical protein
MEKLLFTIILIPLFTFGQLVTINQVSTSQVNTVYSGPNVPVAAISLVVEYDTTLWNFDSVTALNPFDSVGFLLISPAWIANIHGRVIIGWMFLPTQDTVMLKSGPMFAIYFRQAFDTCVSLRWSPTPGDCEIVDMDYLAYQLYYSDTVICNATTGIQTVTGRDRMSQGYDLLGRPNDKGVIIRNGRKYYR